MLLKPSRLESLLHKLHFAVLCLRLWGRQILSNQHPILSLLAILILRNRFTTALYVLVSNSLESLLKRATTTQQNHMMT